MIEIPVAGGLVALVDDADAAQVRAFKWRPYWSRNRRLCYARAWTKGSQATRKLVLMHTLIAGHRWVDHRNGNGLDNQRGNLRPATPAQNAANRRKRPGTSSQFKGVTWNKAVGRWMATIQTGGRSSTLGYFTHEADAARAYNRAAIERFGDYALVNEVPAACCA